MTTRPYELLARFNADGTVGGVSVRTITTVDGRDYESDPMPLSGTSDPAFKPFADQFASTSESERIAGIAEIARLTAELSASNAARDAALEIVAKLQPLADSVPALQAEIARLTALVPPPLPPRSIYPRELLSRLTFAEVVAAIRTEDDAAIYAVANLQTTVSPVDLDSEETRTLIGALVMAGILTHERLAEILA